MRDRDFVEGEACGIGRTQSKHGKRAKYPTRPYNGIQGRIDRDITEIQRCLCMVVRRHEGPQTRVLTNKKLTWRGT